MDAGEEEAGFLKYPFRLQNLRDLFGRFWTHIACFSSTSELPSQWHNYANAGTGCAIGIEYSALRTWCDEKHLSLVPMIYELDTQERMITGFLAAERSIRIDRKPKVRSGEKDSFRWTGLKFVISLALALKDESWRSEQETRILIIRRTNSPDFLRKVRTDGVAYFELPICIFVTEIVLGPQCNLASEELAGILSDTGLSAAKVRRTSCQCPPFSS
jgi:hypothetical protein